MRHRFAGRDQIGRRHKRRLHKSRAAPAQMLPFKCGQQQAASGKGLPNLTSSQSKQFDSDAVQICRAPGLKPPGLETDSPSSRSW